MAGAPPVNTDVDLLPVTELDLTFAPSHTTVPRSYTPKVLRHIPDLVWMVTVEKIGDIDLGGTHAEGGWSQSVIHTERDPEYGDPFGRIGVAGVDELQRITPLDKAAAVPVIRIQQIDRDSNEPIGTSLTNQMNAPPTFGASLDQDRYGERPLFSLGKVTVKTVNPMGLIMFREISIGITVHRPDVIFKRVGEPNARGLASLLTPGTTHMLTYGWQGSEAPLVGGPSDRKRLLMSDRSLRFSVVDYSFSIRGDGQIDLNIRAIEDGELHVRNAVFLDTGEAGKKSIEELKDEFLTKMNALKVIVRREIPQEPPTIQASGSIQNVNRPSFTPAPPTLTTFPDSGEVYEEYIMLKDVFDIFLTYPLAKAFSNLGYTDIKLHFGVFNANAPSSSEKFGGMKYGSRPIGAYYVPLAIAKKTVDDILRVGEQITVYNFMRSFLNTIHDPRNWEINPSNPKDPKDENRPLQSIPEMHIRTIFDGSAVRVWVVDAKRYFTTLGNGFTSEHLYYQAKQDLLSDHDRLDTFLRTREIPKISFGRADSFLQDARFEVVNDELMKSVFLERATRPSRYGITGNTEMKNMQDRSIDSKDILYRSAITGQLTMLGNFVFDMFGIMWMDFNVDAWSGLFYVREKVDTIGADGFTTVLSVVSEGSNPLNSPAMPPTTEADWHKNQREKEQQAAEALHANEIHWGGSSSEDDFGWREPVNERKQSF